MTSAFFLSAVQLTPATLHRFLTPSTSRSENPVRPSISVEGREARELTRIAQLASPAGLVGLVDELTSES